MNTTILVIEDNEQNLYLMRFLLEKHGFQVVEARDGQDGIRRACAIRPALILLDIQLPVMDGYSVARALRQEAALRETPIVAVTSYAMAGDRERALAAGATDYIEKPVDPDTFVPRIRQHLPDAPAGSR
jgi:two-component system, cell cycle response regulator DivK